ncbi:hypothetical protein Tco_0889254 [Tanacetum coccineum]
MGRPSCNYISPLLALERGWLFSFLPYFHIVITSSIPSLSLSKHHNPHLSLVLGLDHKITCFFKTLEDNLRAYHSSIRCAPFGALYGRKCRSPVLWAEIGESRLIGLELVQETTDKVVLIKEKLKAARDRQKSYADNRRKLLEFEVADQVLLKVSPWKGVVDKTLRFVEEPVEIIDREVKSLKRSRIPIVKVHWNLKRGHEDFIKSKYPHLLVEQAIVRSTK